jgi:hypothetical protein
LLVISEGVIVTLPGFCWPFRGSKLNSYLANTGLWGMIARSTVPVTESATLPVSAAVLSELWGLTTSEQVDKQRVNPKKINNALMFFIFSSLLSNLLHEQ